jgi:hypothetical protein
MKVLTRQGRIMKMLTAMSLFNEVGLDTFIAKPLAGIYVTGSPLKEAVLHL